MSKLINITTFYIILLGFGVFTPVLAQQKETYEERVNALKKLKLEDEKSERDFDQIIQSTSLKIEKMALPPLSIFMDAVTENATVKRSQSQVDQMKNEYRLQKRDWWNYLRLNGMYSYGRYNILSNNSDEYTPLYQTSMASAQHNFNVGASITVPIGDLVNRSLKMKKYKYDIEQLQYTQEEVIEERRLKVLDVYNSVIEQLATIKAKSEMAALYNAQMKITENNFIQGKIDIIALSLERARRVDAITSYEQSRIVLYNSITLLEMLTNVKIIRD